MEKIDVDALVNTFKMMNTREERKAVTTLAIQKLSLIDRCNYLVQTATHLEELLQISVKAV
jgi:hypothetical protein